MRIREYRSYFLVTDTVSEILKHLPDFSRSLKTKYFIVHEIAIMKEIPIKLITRVDVDIFYKDMPCVLRKKSQKLRLGFPVDMMEYID